MSSRVKNFRRRTEDTEQNTEETKPSPKPQPAFNRPRPPKPDPSQTRTRLSFADDEEEDAEDAPFRSSGSHRPVKAKPVSAIHKLTSSSKEQRIKGKKGLSYSSSPNPPSNLQSQAGEYTKEKLLELQKNAKPLGSMPKPPPAPKPTALFSGLDPKLVKSSNKPAEPVVVLKGLVKPMAMTPPSASVSTSISAKDEVEVEEDDDEEEETAIPDQATINAIKAKRQQSLQPRHAAPEFISLDGGGLVSSRRSEGGSSDDDDTELDGRIGFLGGDTNKGKGGGGGGVFEEGPSINITDDVGNKIIMNNDKLKDLGLHEEAEDEEDEEERKWEEEQFRKGLGQAYRFDESSSSSSLHSAPNQQQPSVFISRSAEVMSFAQQAEVAIRSVRENIAKLSHTHKSSLASLVRTEAFLSEALLEISSLEESIQADDSKYAYMQQLREYVSVLCDFLNDKAFYIEELEEQMQRLHEKRALAVSERRAADLSDESAEMEPAVKAAMAILSNNGSDVSSSARAAALAAKEAFSRSVETKKLDEFGRDENLKRRMDLARRAEGRKKRRTRNESKRMAFNEKSGANSIEGELSTDESESEKDAYVSSRDELLRTAGMVFSDASDEYADLKHVKERFEGWKNRYRQAYRDAYVSLSVPAVFSPYVRLELLKWDPLYHTADFVDMDWHDLLFDYDGSEEDEEDMDSNLIPELVEKVALPILHHEIEHCWDVFSTQKTQNAVFAAKMVINYLSLSSKALHELLGMVAVRLTEAVDALDVPLWGPSVVKTVPGAGELCAYRFGMSVRLLRNICLWKDILAGPVIEKIAMDELLRGKILRHVKSMGLDLHDAVSRLERVVDSISGLASGLGVGRLLEFVKELGAKLEKRHKSGVVSEEETHRLARRLKKMLLALNDYDGARAILKAFQLKEAL
ncbi:hypothetical protein LUZ60_002541 [Juncus effusus]|nr:hypothetical protein LUZ60_002541 [Juncus effusus]